MRSRERRRPGLRIHHSLALAGAAVGLFEPAWALPSLSLSTLMSIPVLLSFWRRA